MTTCENLCTAAKCRELEQRIQQLEAAFQILEGDLAVLEADLSNHKSQGIPEAHYYDLPENNNSINIEGFYQSNGIFLSVASGSNQDTAFVLLPFVTQEQFDDHKRTKIPDAHSYEHKASVNVDVIPHGNDGYGSNEYEISVTVDGSESSDFIGIPSDWVTKNEFNEHLNTSIPEAHNYKPSVTFDIFETPDGFVLKSNVDGYTDEDVLSTSKIADKIKDYYGNNPSLDPYQISIDGFYENHGIFLSLSMGNSNDTTEIWLPFALPEEVIDLIDRHAPGGGGGGGGGGAPPDTEGGVALAGAYGKEENSITLVLAVTGNGAATATINLDGIMGNIEQIVQRIFNLLGGTEWDFNADNVPSRKINPEYDLKALGQALYQTKNGSTDTSQEVVSSNITNLLLSYQSVAYMRSGFHRLPAKTVTNILNTDEGNEEIKIADTLSFQEWVFKNLDAIIGEFPLKIEHINEDKEKNEIVFNNYSELASSIVGTLVNLSDYSNYNLNATLKSLAEARQAANAAILAVDYGKANARYLGYEGREKKRKIRMSFDPTKKELKKALKPSEQELISWVNQDKETLVGLIKRVLVSAEIIKAAFYKPYERGDKVTGEWIKESNDESKELQEEAWEEFKNKINNPTGIREDDRKPRAKIKDYTKDDK